MRVLAAMLTGALCAAAQNAALQNAAPQNTSMALTLGEAEQLAAKNNPRIGAARFNAAAAGRIPAELHSSLEPNLSGNLTGVGADSGSRLAAGALNNPVIYSRLGTGVALNQVLTDFGRTGNLVASARLRAQALNRTAETTKAQVLLATDRAYFDLLRARAVLRVAQQTVAARQTVSDQVSALAQARMKSELDLSFARVNLNEARLLLANAQSDVAADEADLAAAMGLPSDTQFTLAEEALPDALPAGAEPLLNEALLNRPELADLRLQRDAAERFVQAEKDLRLPTVSAAGAAGFVPAGENAVPGRYGAVGINVNIPVFNGGLFRARREEAEFRARAAANNLSDVENQVARDVRVAFLNARNAFERVGLTAQLLDQAQLALDLAQRRYDLGLSSIVELTQAQLSLTSAQIAGATAKYDYQQARSVLRYQTGTLQ